MTDLTLEHRPAAGSRDRVEARPGDPVISAALVAEHGLSPEEWEQILALMGREPTFTELGVFSAMWSEHCGYKNSRPLLKTLPTESAAVVQGPGENAGVIDVGGGWGVAFKIESHNHPSAVEPYQGAATGSGGILRDVFTMGARPIAIFDSLHFGSLDSPQSRYLFDGVVRGVGDYGNCVGVPTVGGEAIFDPAYEKNPLINVMCIGVLPLERLIRGEAEGVGNPVMAVGARTGRDGIHGATFASEELDEEALDSRPQVQVGDPFTEKLLLEASLELIERDLLVGIQDMGAAGLTSSGTEMAARSGSGIDIDVAYLPVREEGMTPYEMLLSESQERMLLVAKPEHEAAVREVLERWDLQAATIGRVTDDGMFRVREAGKVRVEIPVKPLVDDCPTYVREGVMSPAAVEAREMDLEAYASFASDGEVEASLRTLLDAPCIASRRWIHEQYDTTVQTNTLEGPGSDAAVLRLPAEGRALAASTDGNGRHTWLDPRTGGRAAVAEAARNVACSGARPLAVTNCLNFGSPRRPEVYFQLAGAVEGMGEACRALGTPVTGGNVSLYNETGGQPVYPTPVIGMLGVIEDLERRVPSAFQREGDEIWVAGVTRDEIGGSEYLGACHGVVAGLPPAVDLGEAAALVDFLVEGAADGAFASAHDGSDGGLAVALAECAVRAAGGPVGCTVDLDLAPAGADLSAAGRWFGESHSRVVLTCRPGGGERIAAHGRRHGVPVERVGTVDGPDGPCRLTGAGHTIAPPVRELARIYEEAIPRRMSEEAGITA
ncbi:phosphoribosylformylglycinamidine synthase subunit PurL [Candidatus Palauibacter sp.]|uniref:phosphoribosylformylglycinamidine synthase subunit PurL n=1 Tax=Candidatus Palauibacter sp. TaxID=3101350 RepID=UPI003C6ECB24